MDSAREGTVTAIAAGPRTVHGSDLRIVAYTAAPGSEAAEKLKLLAVIGTQVLR